MSRRIKLILLIVATAALLGLGLWLLLTPLIGPPEQPPELPPAVTPSGEVPEIREPVQPPLPTVTQEVRQLENLAVSVVTRIGSGSSADGFRGYEDVLLSATPAMQDALRRERAAMQAAHPADGPAYGVTSRVVAVDRRFARPGEDRVTFVLQVQRSEDAGNPSAPTSVTYHEATVTMAKQPDGGYLVDEIVWQNIQI